MKRRPTPATMSRLVAFLLASFLAAGTAFASPPSEGPVHRTVDGDQTNGLPLLNNAGLEVTRSFLVPNNVPRGMAVLTLWAQYTFANAGDVTITCKGARRQSSGTPTLYDLQACSVGLDGVCTLVDSGVFKRPVTANKNYQIPVGILGLSNAWCSVSHSAGTSADRITIGADLSTQ